MPAVGHDGGGVTTLATFQRQFAASVIDDLPAFAPATHPAFAVYRNTPMRACLDALEANFPAVACLVGREWFRAAAAIHVAACPPCDPRLFLYGEAFPAFLDSFEPAMALPYLADVARLDRLWSESLNARDAAALVPSGLPLDDAEALGATRLRVHPSLRRIASPYPVVSIWKASRQGVAVGEDLAWEPEHALVTRTGLSADVTPVDPAAFAFLDAIDNGMALVDATTHTGRIHPDASLDHLLADLFRAGAFTP